LWPFIFGLSQVRAASCPPTNRYKTLATNAFYVSMKLDGEGNPVIAYTDNSQPPNKLKLAHCGNPRCTSGTSITVDSGQAGLYNSLAINSAGNPVISYFYGDEEFGYGQLRVAVCGKPNCSSGNVITTVDRPKTRQGGLVGQGTSLALDGSGNPVIAYYVNQNGGDQMRLVHCGNPACTAGNSFIKLEAGNFAGPTLALDPGGNPVIAYQEGIQPLHIVHCGDVDCANHTSITHLTNTGANMFGGNTTLAVDTAGNPIYSYPHVDTRHAEQRLMHCGNGTCRSGNSFSEIDPKAADQSSLVLNAEGDPVIAYQSGGNLIVFVCGDANCTSGNTRTVADTTENSGIWPSIQLDAQQNPVVAYVRLLRFTLTLLHCGTTTCQ
jgi:hypothetical protein